MKTFEIEKDSPWTYYKKEKPIPPGEYMVVGNPSKEEKQQFPIYPAQGLNGFRWILKMEDWVYQEKFGLSTQVELSDDEYNSLDLNAADDAAYRFNLRKWQERLFNEVLDTLENSLAFRKGLIAPVGAGKTLFFLLLAQLGPTLYIAPRHLHGTITDEAIKWDLELPVITTPESCHKKEGNFLIGIIDECLSVKNPGAIRSKRVQEVCKNALVVVAGTGTPMSAETGLDLRWLRVLGSCVPEEEKHWKWKFGINPHYEDLQERGVEVKPTEGGFIPKPLEVDGWELKKITDFTSDFVTTVDISEIMQEVPGMEEKNVYFTCPRLYKATLKGLFTDKGTKKRLIQARTLTAGFFYADDGTPKWVNKILPKVEYIRGFLDSNPSEPVVVFAYWRAEILKVCEILTKYNPAKVLSGEDNSEEIRKFTTGQTNLIIISASMTEGMNLQRARFGFFLSNSFSPVKRVQAVGRLYRQGQKRGVIIYNLLCKGTLDEKHLEALKEYENESAEFIRQQLEKELEKMKL